VDAVDLRQQGRTKRTISCYESGRLVSWLAFGEPNQRPGLPPVQQSRSCESASAVFCASRHLLLFSRQLGPWQWLSTTADLPKNHELYWIISRQFWIRE
jgi:hypothetical protein